MGPHLCGPSCDDEKPRPSVRIPLEDRGRWISDRELEAQLGQAYAMGREKALEDMLARSWDLPDRDDER